MLNSLLKRLARRLGGWRVVRDDDVVLLERFKIFDGVRFGVYLHHCTFPDEAEGIYHDHPWSWSASIVVTGKYVEERPRFGEPPQIRELHRGSVNLLPRDTFHRIVSLSPGGAWTIYFRGRRAKPDGFLVFQEGSWVYEPGARSPRERKIAIKEDRSAPGRTAEQTVRPERGNRVS